MGRWKLCTAIVLGGGAIVACTGGGGALDASPWSWESAASSFERAPGTHERPPGYREAAPASTERAGRSSEIAPGTQAPAGPATQSGENPCAGTFLCREEGDDDVDALVLVSSGNDCVGSGFVLSSDGTISLAGRKVGTWQATGDGLTATTPDGTVVCTRGGAAPSPRPPSSDDDEPPPAPPPMTGGDPGTVVLDAGTNGGG